MKMTNGIKFKYYVATIGNDGRYYYVTDIDNSTKTFWRDANKEAKAFSKACANDMQFAMSVNGYVTVVVQFPEWIVPMNPDEGHEGDGHNYYIFRDC